MGDVKAAERDEARDFGNEQDMSVHDKDHPTLGPTEEAQDVSTLAQQVVPMPAFNDPNNPVAASGSVNLSLNDHPVQHAEDYGADVLARTGLDHVEHPMSEGAKGLREFDLSQATVEQRAAFESFDAPADREEWQKAHWASAAQAYGLSHSGNKAALRARVEEHEAAVEERNAYTSEVNALTREELDQAAADRGIDPEEYSTKELLATAVIAAEFGEDVPEGDKLASNGS